MKWTIDGGGAWRMTLEMLDPTYLQDLKAVQAGLGEKYGVPKLSDLDPEKELQEIVEIELLYNLARKHDKLVRVLR